MVCTTRTEFLRQNTLQKVHAQARTFLDRGISTADLTLSLPERKARSLQYVFEHMPPYIGEQELIVGSRTLYLEKPESKDDKSNVGHYNVMPLYMTEKDAAYYGGWGQCATKGHYTCDYGILLKKGIGGIIAEAEENSRKQTIPHRQDWLKGVAIAYTGLSKLIRRYAKEAESQAAGAAGERAKELRRIAAVCERIATEPAYDFWSAVQLFWFGHLAVTVENFQFMNYGRVDQFLYPYLDGTPEEEAQQLVECVLIKMYDQVDLCGETPLGTLEAQHNITIGGMTPVGKDAVNRLSRMFVTAIGRVHLPEPEVSVRLHKGIDEVFVQGLCDLSAKGYNYIAYYNDDLFIPNLIRKHVRPELAYDYSFDLCQDMCVAGKSNWFYIGCMGIIVAVMKALEQANDSISYEEFLANVKHILRELVHRDIERYDRWLQAVRRYNDGDVEFYTQQVKDGNIPLLYVEEGPTSPLPIASGLYHGCVEQGIDLAMHGQEDQHAGYFISDIVTGINSLAALKKLVFEEKAYTLSQVRQACEANFEGYEIMRQRLFHAPKWGNDDDYVDAIGVDVIEDGLREISRHTLCTGEPVLAGIHQPHPVFRGNELGATPEGRLKGMPIPVTLTPENGTAWKGPTASFRSAAKIDHNLIDWNNCLMLQYSDKAFAGENGGRLFRSLLETFFAKGGMQHQANVLSVEDLKAAKEHPEQYQDLTVRLWGVSARFVDLEEEHQDEVIARYETL